MTQSSQKALDLQVLPLRDVVVFPYMVIPLFVGREKSMRALERQWTLISASCWLHKNG